MATEEPKAGLSTLREILDAVLGMAASMPGGLDTPAEFGLCDGSGLRILTRADIQALPAGRDAGHPSAQPAVLIRVCDHAGGPGPRGRLLRGVTPHAGEGGGI